MAKHKKTKKRRHPSHGRRHRVGALHPALAQTGMMLLGAGVGAIAGSFVNQAVKTSFTTAPSYLGGGACVAIGAATVMFAPPTPLITGIGAGLMGVGAVFATNETFLSLPGISGMPLDMMNPGGPGYMQRTVGSYKGIPRARIGTGGNLSGNNQHVIAGMNGIYRN